MTNNNRKENKMGHTEQDRKLEALLRGLTRIRQTATDADELIATVLKDKTPDELKTFVVRMFDRIIEEMRDAGAAFGKVLGASDEELHQAGTEEPVVPGDLPTGADGTPEGEKRGTDLEFHGLRLFHFGGYGLNSTFIGRRVNKPDSGNDAQIFKIEVARPDSDGECVIRCTENGKYLFHADTRVNFSMAKKMAVSALRSILSKRKKDNRRHHLANKAKRAAQRAAAEEEAK